MGKHNVGVVLSLETPPGSSHKVVGGVKRKVRGGTATKGEWGDRITETIRTGEPAF